MFEKPTIEKEEQKPELLEIHHIFETAEYGGRRIKTGENTIKFAGFFKSKEALETAENILKEIGCGVEKEDNELFVEAEFSADEIAEANLEYQSN